MRLITEDLPEDLARALLRHNIRFVEQFLTLLRDPTSAQNLAAALGRSVDSLRTIAERVRKEHPELTIPEPSQTRHSMGLGKESDWDNRYPHRTPKDE
jgi:hypothetical protein